MTSVIETRGLQKHFGRVHALDGLDLTVAEGEVHGFLGPNGAGKSTTIRVLLGLIRPSGGQALVFGDDPWSTASRLHQGIAYVPGDVALWPNLSGGETIDLIARLRGADTRAVGGLCLRRGWITPRQRVQRPARTVRRGAKQHRIGC